jgi:methyl-accepting chemotaxis protein
MITTKFRFHQLGAASIKVFARIPWPLGRKIQVILIFLMSIMLLSGITTIVLLLNISNNHQAQSEAANRVQIAQNINQYLTSQLALYSDAVLINRQSVTFDDYSSHIQAELTKLTQSKLPDNQSGQLIKTTRDNLANLYPQITVVLDQLNSLLDKNNLSAAQALWSEKSSLVEQTKTLANTLQRLIGDEQNQLTQAIDTNISISFWITCGLVTFTMLVLGAVALLLTRALGGAMQQLKHDLDLVASGDLNVQINTHHRDEIGEVVIIFNRALTLLRDVISNAAVGREVNGLAEHLASTSREQVTLVGNQLAEVSVISSAMEELASTIQHILQNSQHVNKAALSALSEAENVYQRTGEVDSSSSVVELATGHARTIVASTEDRAAKLALELQELAQQSQKVSKVTDFISNVAAQTHILALNAAIEAAGAGEYGERFAVIASEVKQLAQQVTGNIGDINTLMAAIQLNIGSADGQAQSIVQEIAQLRVAEDEVSNGVEVLVKNARDGVEKAASIVEAASLTVKLTEQIEVAIQQHQVGSLRVINSLSEIKATVEVNSSATQVLEDDSGRLEKLSQQLSLALSQVRLK